MAHRDSGQGRFDPGTRSQGSSSASEYAATYRARERNLSSETSEGFISPTDDEIRRDNAMTPERSARPLSSPATYHSQDAVPRSVVTGRPRATYARISAKQSRGSSASASDTDGSYSTTESYHDWSDEDMDIDLEPANYSAHAPHASPPSQFSEFENNAGPAIPRSMPTATRYYNNVVHGHSSTSTGPPPGPFPTRGQPDMCVVCKVSPVYETQYGLKPYPTCGLKCAAKHEEDKARARPYASSPSWPPKCVVCGIKDQYYNRETGKRYPTCGLTCASTQKFKASGAAAGNCEFCHKHPKAISRTTGKPYEFCRRECMEKSKAKLAKAMEGTCRTCLICLRSSVVDLEKPYCGLECLLSAERLAPTMVEIPRGHVMFNKYNRRFQDGWKTSSDGKTTVKHMYFFAQSPAVRDRYAKYKENFKSSHRNKPAMEKELWIAVFRECNTGDSGEVDLCQSSTCPFCSIVRYGFQPQDYPGGATLASSSASASETLNGAASRRSTNILMNVRLAFAPGNGTPEVTMHEIRIRSDEMRKVHPVVKIYETKGYRRVDTGGMHVFEPAAILPLGCVVYV